MIDLSVIIPAYNEEKRLPRTLPHVINYLLSLPFSQEIIIVENGSTDQTAAVIRQLIADYPDMPIRLIQTQPGKGRAIREGMVAARGRYRYMADADFSTPIEELPRIWGHMNGSADVVIGSRQGQGARREGDPLYRHIMGRCFNTLIQALIVPGIRDSQCGFKLFSDRAAGEIFKHQRLDGMAFDVEVIYLARRLGYRVLEVGGEWHHDHDSRVRPLADSFHMARDILKIRGHELIGSYETHGVSLPTVD